MSVEGDICSYFRQAKNKKKAIEIAAVVFSRSREEILKTLKSSGLMSDSGDFIAPLRLTGKEKSMATQWKWMPQRKDIYTQFVATGLSPEKIAEAFGPPCTVEIVKEYERKLAMQASPVTITKPAKTPAPQQAIKDKANSPTEPRLMDEITLNTVKLLAHQALIRNRKIKAVYADERAEGYFALGEQRGILAELCRLLGVEVGEAKGDERQ